MDSEMRYMVPVNEIVASFGSKWSKEELERLLDEESEEVKPPAQ